MKHLILWPLGLLIGSVVCSADPPETGAFGHPNHGLASHVEISGRQFTAGKPVLVSYTVQNLAATPTRIWHSGFWANHQIRVCDQNGKLAALSAFGQERFKAFSPGGARNKNFPVDIKPGSEDKSDGDTQDITRLYDLSSPGIYSVQALYEEYQGGWEGQLWSNVIVIHIVNP